MRNKLGRVYFKITTSEWELKANLHQRIWGITTIHMESVCVGPVVQGGSSIGRTLGR